MRILYFHQYFTTPKGVGGNRSYWLAKALLDAGHQVHMVCGNSLDANTGINVPFVNGKRSGQFEGIDITEFELNYSNELSFVKRTFVFMKFAVRSIKVALTDDYDVIFCSSTPLTASLPGIFARWLRRKRFVLEIRDLWPELPKAMGVITNPIILWAISALEWISYRSAHACIGLSPGIVEGIKRRSSKNLTTTMLPNGCDLGVFEPATVKPIDIDGIEKEDFVGIFIGAHGLANGLDAVLDAASVLMAKGMNHIKLLFLGNGMQKKHLLERKEKENLSNCIFLPPVPKNELSSYMQRADVGLMVLKNVPAFYYGTSPNKFFDYLTAGKPVINNYPGWLADLITEHDMGIAVPAESPEQFADALNCLSKDKERVAKMGANSAALAKSHFDRAKIASEFVTFLEQQQQR